jgi:hypothetical protein
LQDLLQVQEILFPSQQVHLYEILHHEVQEQILQFVLLQEHRVL